MSLEELMEFTEEKLQKQFPPTRAIKEFRL